MTLSIVGGYTSPSQCKKSTFVTIRIKRINTVSVAGPAWQMVTNNKVTHSTPRPPHTIYCHSNTVLP